jgi:hypothetical protein
MNFSCAFYCAFIREGTFILVNLFHVGTYICRSVFAIFHVGTYLMPNNGYGLSNKKY